MLIIDTVKIICLNKLPFLFQIYVRSYGIEDSEILMLVLDIHEIQQNHTNPLSPKLRNVLLVTK